MFPASVTVYKTFPSLKEKGLSCWCAMLSIINHHHHHHHQTSKGLLETLFLFRTVTLSIVYNEIFCVPTQLLNWAGLHVRPHFLPKPSKFVHRYICYICDILHLCILHSILLYQETSYCNKPVAIDCYYFFFPHCDLFNLAVLIHQEKLVYPCRAVIRPFDQHKACLSENVLRKAIVSNSRRCDPARCFLVLIDLFAIKFFLGPSAP